MKIYVNQYHTLKQAQKYKELKEELDKRGNGGEQNLAIREWNIVTVNPRPRDGAEGGERPLRSGVGEKTA